MMSYSQEKILPYDSGQKKVKQVEDMFDTIAHSYDKLNHRLSFGRDRSWRKKAINNLKVFEPENVLDIATGTADFAIEVLNELNQTKIVGIDISYEMLELAKRKVREKGLEKKITFLKQDVQNLEFLDSSFDAITIAFGIRNFENMDLALKEIYRVLKKDGQLVILELTRPMKFPIRQLFWAYSHTILPLYGRIVSKDSKAYDYLTNTIEAFPQEEVMKKAFKKAGFNLLKYEGLTFGICSFYLLTK